MAKTQIQRVSFPNSEGHELAAKIELPADGQPKAFALFAHCFTCGKNLSVVRNISRELTSYGFGVLVFDFTGLGESEGEFSDSNFSGNVNDLIAAADYLRKEYSAPRLLVGHSLGGATVLCAAASIEEVQAISTIGSPFDPGHVVHLFDAELEEIKEKGMAKVSLGPRLFTIKQQLIDDLETAGRREHIKHLKKALLVMHSPQDDTVDIENAKRIYDAAMHPKSFISLDGADHLLTNAADASYAGNVIGSWASRYVDFEKVEEIKTDQQVVSVTGSDGYTTQIRAGEHYLIADEPASYGGKELGPSPYGYLMTALGACTGMTLRMYADHKKWDLQEVRVHLSHAKVHADDSMNNQKIDQITRRLEIEGNLDEEQRERLLQIADRCPVHKTLHNPVEVITSLDPVE